MFKLLVGDVCFLPDNQHICNETCLCLSRLPANIFISEPETGFSFVSVLVCLVRGQTSYSQSIQYLQFVSRPMSCDVIFKNGKMVFPNHWTSFFFPVYTVLTF